MRWSSDLQVINPKISPNLLSKRLCQLQEAGLVTRRDLPPPAAAAVSPRLAYGIRRSAVATAHPVTRPAVSGSWQVRTGPAGSRGAMVPSGWWRAEGRRG